ncbi:hypothetical protein [Bacillus sonorensis]|uniref:hypothetical protein n=1 Tax=Bacillus sonorensis TaxID=119858 RepID=UPI00227E13ED|nr:hypothetical protein [Bacillus sonorensis]MCY8026882.1 hypothetical protein [Bacillus sonorensis]MCY8403564.1 hypothetical protein [Bacillus sonorensis]
MQASKNILSTWRKFDRFPMETLTKAWFYQQAGNRKRREVSLMKEHYRQFGISGNCFDLAIWLLDEFSKEGIEAYPIGHHFKTEDAHAAVIALDERGRRFLCDLGDQWLQPILVDIESEDYTNEKLSGFFPAAQVQITPVHSHIEVVYHRPNGKTSKQGYNPEPVEMKLFLEAAEYSQRTFNREPLLECRVPYQDETAHWEFCDWSSWLSTSRGIVNEPAPDTIEGWVENIHHMAGYDKHVLREALEIYKFNLFT